MANLYKNLFSLLSIRMVLNSECQRAYEKKGDITSAYSPVSNMRTSKIYKRIVCLLTSRTLLSKIHENKMMIIANEKRIPPLDLHKYNQYPCNRQGVLLPSTVLRKKKQNIQSRSRPSHTPLFE